MNKRNSLKHIARKLRTNQTDAENFLWSKIRRKQIHGIQFYRQKVIKNYIVDFYAPSVKMVIELDGGQHFEESYIKKDKKRDDALKKLNLKVIRFNNFEVMTSINSVIDSIASECILDK